MPLRFFALVKYYETTITLGSPVMYRHSFSVQFAGLTSEQEHLAPIHSSYQAVALGLMLVLVACAYHTSQPINASLEVQRRRRAYSHQLQ